MGLRQKSLRNLEEKKNIYIYTRKKTTVIDNGVSFYRNYGAASVGEYSR